MEKIIIEGGRKLSGLVKIAPAKNACLPIIASAIATRGNVVLANAPKISDVVVMAEIIGDLGGKFEFNDDGLLLGTDDIKSFVGNGQFYGRVRASLFTAGALLTRFRKAYIPYPGGCNIGKRPIDIHIDGLKALGVVADCAEDGVYFDGNDMHAGVVRLRYPSVGATVNIICAALCLDGETIIEGGACEPEITDMCVFLKKCGYKINMHNGTIRIIGIKDIPQANVLHKPVGDRIEAGTFMLACVACGGEIALEFDCGERVKAVIDAINKTGARAYFYNGEICVRCENRPKSVDVVADVYPSFPTDLQPQFCAAMTVADGCSIVTDKVFQGRFCYSEMLNRFGAKTQVENGHLKINGVERLKSASVEASDLRGGAALCIAAMAAEGKSVINRSDTICRGYEDLCEKINLLGGCANEI